MAVLIGSNDAALFPLATNTYSAGSGECFYSVTANATGTVNTLKIRMSTFNATTQLALRVRGAAGALLASGVIATPATVGEREVSVTPFGVTAGQSYLLSIVANTGSPQPFQSSSTGIYNQSGSTFASPQDPLTLPGNFLSAVRKFHMWAEGEAAIDPRITVAGDVVHGTPKTWTSQDFDPAINAATLDGVACSAVSNTGFTPPALVDGQVTARPGSRTITATNGTQSDSEDVNVAPPPGFNYVQLIAQSTDPARATPAESVAGDHFMYENKNGTVITSAGLPSSNHEGEILAWLVKDATKIAGQYAIIFGDGGQYIETRSLAVAGLGAKGLATSGLAMVGL